MKRNQFEMIAMAGMISGAASMAYLVIDKFDTIDGLIPMAITSVVSVLVALYVSFIVKSLNKNPTPLRAFLIGLPRAGKTVYLSVLFDELQRYSSSNMDFQQYGSETVEKVNSNLNALRQGNWVPRTEVNTAFYYRARASVGSGAFGSKYTLEVGDYAGEHIEEFDSSSELWLHKTDYFKYALASDALLFCVDGAHLVNEDKYEIESSQAMLLAAFQMLLSEKTSHAGRKLNIPICLIVLKSDLFENDSAIDHLLDQYFYRLRELMKSKSMDYREFYVSAIGKTVDGLPPSRIEPRNVVEPFVWLLKHTRL
jgi:GTPase SAR1 family protein